MMWHFFLSPSKRNFSTALCCICNDDSMYQKQWESSIGMCCQTVGHIVYCIWEAILSGSELQPSVLLYHAAVLQG